MNSRRLLLCVVLAAGLVAGCKPVNPYYDPAKAHHTPSGFRNNYVPPAPGSINFWRWQLSGFFNGDPVPPMTSLAPVAADLPWIQAPDPGVRVTWVGHSTLLVQVGEFNLLTDPMFSERASPVSFMGPRRWQPPGIALKDLPHIHAVVISHNHYDSLDLPSVKALAAQRGGPPVFIVPLGVDVWFRLNVPLARDLRPLDWWQETVVGDAVFTLAPVQHWSGRGFFDRGATLWGAWSVRWGNPAFKFLFGGDLGYSEDLRTIGERLGPFDLAALPIGGYVPRWLLRTYHMNPTEAVQAHRDVRAAASVAIHWGTFGLGAETLDRPLRTLVRARHYAEVEPNEFFTMKHGESRVWNDGAWAVRPPSP